MDKTSGIVGNDSQTMGQSAEMQEGQEQQVNAGAIRKSTTNSILNALSNASGQNFESVESALSFIARTTAQQGMTNNQPQTQQTEETQSRSNRVTTNDLHERFNELQSNLAKKEQALREKELDSDIQRAMGDRFDSDLTDYALSKVRSNVQWNNDGTYSIVNNKGQERYGMDGSPLTIQGLVQEVAQGNPKLLKQSNSNSGSGLRPGQGSFAGAPEDSVPDYSKDPAAFNQWAQRNGLGKNVGLKSMTVSATSNFPGQKIL